MKNYVTTALHALEARRAEKHEWARLEREISGYTTPSDRADLEATFERYPDEDTSEMRRFLAAQTSQLV